MLYAVRGAIDVVEDNPEAIAEAVKALCAQLFDLNPSLSPLTVLNIFFTQTADLCSKNPALALRESFPAWGGVPLVCSQEVQINGMLPRCIRILIQWQCNDVIQPQPVYLKKAALLRPDLVRT